MRYTSDKIISFSILINGTCKRVRFIPKMQGGSIYVTNHQPEIKALEASDMYNRVYKRTPDCKDEELSDKKDVKNNPTDKKVKAKNVKNIASWQEAVEYLVKECGSDAEALTTPEAIANEAAEKGINFVGLK